MPIHVALLRGVNVGGRNRLSMADLRAVVTSLGHTDVVTYIQSGNVVFSSTETNATALAAALEQAIAQTLDVHPSVVVVSSKDLARIVAGNPYPDEKNPKCLHVVFSPGTRGPAERAAVATALERAREKGSPDEATIVGRTLYLRTPDGLGRSELAAQLGRANGPLAAPSATIRNWATVLKLLELSG